jgi:hypothetical protein
MELQLLTKEMQSCVDQCDECHNVCLQMIEHCLSKGGNHSGVDHIRALMDCIEICAVSADFMVRGSVNHQFVCQACAEVCATCAESCEAMSDDEEMNRCAEVCRRCEASCREMAEGGSIYRTTA